MRSGQVERRTHDYTRHGTLSLFAALDAATGAVIGKCFARHRARELRPFLNVIEANVPGDLDVHVITDNVSTHNTQAIRNWFARRPRWHTHDTPTSASWISLVASSPTSPRKHRSNEELEAAIASYIDAVNAKPTPFVWTKSADDILASVKRFCAATLSAAQTQIQIATISESGR